MKIHIVYLRTMQNSPEVRIISATTDETLAQEAFARAKQEEVEWQDASDSGDWAEACTESIDMLAHLHRGEKIHVVVETVWHEGVETTISPFLYEQNAVNRVNERRQARLEEYDRLIPYDEEESVDEAMHLHNPSVMVDVYFSIETVTVE